jgi:16S rRNA G966 N2-methylase RsmD
MPHLKSLAGLRMSAKYVRNWYSLFAIYSNILPHATIKFRDGQKTEVYKNNFLEFYEGLYTRYLKDHGFNYEIQGNNVIVRTPGGLLLKLPKPPYSFVLDEIFIMKVYGKPDLTGRAVIDIGSSIGDSALFFASLGANEIHCFEIDKSLCYLAEENVKLNELSTKIQIYNQAATIKSLRALISQKKLENIFMKIDCEGCEVDIINSLDNNIINYVNDIVLEYHYKVKPLSDRLESLGFNVRHENEILFARKPLSTD